jgi:oxysterol-binding protein-related protein 3/6/7
MRSELPQKKERGAPKKSKSEKDKHGGHSKEAAALFALFKKCTLACVHTFCKSLNKCRSAGNHASTGDSVTDDSSGDASYPLSDASLPERVQIALDKLKAQHAGLLKALQILSLSEASQSASQTPVLPATVKEEEEEEEDSKTPILAFSPMTRLTKRSSITTSFSDTVSEWFDAQDNLDGAQEFVLDAHSSPIEMEQDRMDSHDSHSSLELPGPGTDTDIEDVEAESSADVPSNIELDKPSQVVRRSRLAAGPVGDEGSLFSILKKNVGKVSPWRNLHSRTLKTYMCI